MIKSYWIIFCSIIVLFLLFFKIKSEPPLTHWRPRLFSVFEWFSTYKQSVGFRDSLYGVTMKSGAVLKHGMLEYSENVILTYVVILLCWARIYNGSITVCMRFLLSLQPFFVFSGCLMNIIKRNCSQGSTFSKKRVRWRDVLRLLLVQLAKWTLRN